MDLIPQMVGGTLDSSSITNINVTNQCFDSSSITNINVTNQCFDCNNYQDIGKKSIVTNQSLNQNTMNYSNNSYNNDFNNNSNMNNNVSNNVNTNINSGTASGKHSRPVGNGKELAAGMRETINANKLYFGVSYDIKDSRCVVEVSTFALGENGKCLGDDWFVFYGNRQSPDRAISYHDDDANKASGVYEDKIVDVDMSMLNTSVNKIAVVLTIDEALENNLNISMLENVTLSCKDAYGTELCKFKLNKYSSELTAVSLAELYKHNGQWKIKIIGEGLKRDLTGLCEFYGLEVC